MAIDSKGVYRSASRVAFFVVLLLIAEAVVAAITALSIACQIHLIEAARAGATTSQTQAEANDARQRLLACIEISTNIAAGILFLVWVYQVSRNAWALNGEGMNYTPGWSVGWFLVPLASLWMPYCVMREIWQVSSRESSQNGQSAPISPVLGAWWLVIVVYSMIQYSPVRFITGSIQLADSLGYSVLTNGLLEFSWGFQIKEIVGIAADVLTIVIVVRVTEFQERCQFAIAPSARQS